MTTNITPFDYSGQQVRTVTIADEPWFVLTDLCKVLEIRSVGNVTARLDEAGVRQADISSGGQNRSVTIVNEPGMYEVVIRSDKPEAANFRRWITTEVLPQIRKTGSYGQQLELPSHAEALRGWADALEQNERDQKAIAARDSHIRELEPKADAYEQFLDGDGTYSIGSAAKIVGWSQNKLFDELRGRGVLIPKGGMRNTPYQKYMHHFSVRAHDFERNDGTRGTSYTTKVRPSGLEFIARKVGRPILPGVSS